MTQHRICKYCGKPVILIPSAAERVKKFGMTVKYYLDLFPSHTKCLEEQHNKETLELQLRIMLKGA